MKFCGGVQILAALIACAIAVSAEAAELEVSELIVAMKNSLEEAQKSAKPPYANVLWMEGEIRYVVKKEGEAGFKAYVVTAEGKYATEAVQQVKFRLEPPKGQQWKVEREIPDAIVAGIDFKARKLFVKDPSEAGPTAIAVDLPAWMKVSDSKGKTKAISDITAGATVRVRFTSVPSSTDRTAMAEYIVINRRGEF